MPRPGPKRKIPDPASRRESVTPFSAAVRRGLVKSLLAWYGRHGRDLPWRSRAAKADPYRVWLSEIMLQQTTVATVLPRYRQFLACWPRIGALAAASLDEVLHEWQGLGYYARARNLHACAQRLWRDSGGVFPDTEVALRALPGTGDYTAAAIAAISFDRPATVIDGNVERVVARLHAIETPLPAAKTDIAQAAAALTPKSRPGDYAQAVMDLGSTICRPRNPGCAACPWARRCRARAAGNPESFPHRPAVKPRPVRHAIAFVAADKSGAVLLRKRALKGLLGGMIEFPSTPWREAPWTLREARAHAPVRGRWRMVEGGIGHTFTHFHLEVRVALGELQGRKNAGGGFWADPGDFDALALAVLTRKIGRHGGTFDSSAD